MKQYIRLPHDETDEAKRYTMPNPDALIDTYRRLRGRAFPPFPVILTCPVLLDTDDLRAVLSLADGYITLTTYSLGQECCVGKLRDIWRARRSLP